MIKKKGGCHIKYCRISLILSDGDTLKRTHYIKWMILRLLIYLNVTDSFVCNCQPDPYVLRDQQQAADGSPGKETDRYFFCDSDFRDCWLVQYYYIYQFFGFLNILYL